MQEQEKREETAGKTRGYICRIAAAAIIVLIVTAIILGYVVSFKGSDGEIRDGLGRLLADVPGALSMILPQWAGHIWLMVDCFTALGLIILADKLFTKSKIYFKGVKNVDF